MMVWGSETERTWPKRYFETLSFLDFRKNWIFFTKDFGKDFDLQNSPKQPIFSKEFLSKKIQFFRPNSCQIEKYYWISIEISKFLFKHAVSRPNLDEILSDFREHSQKCPNSLKFARNLQNFENNRRNFQNGSTNSIQNSIMQYMFMAKKY